MMGWLLEKPNETKLEKVVKNFIAYFEPPYWFVLLVGFVLGILLMLLIL